MGYTIDTGTKMPVSDLANLLRALEMPGAKWIEIGSDSGADLYHIEEVEGSLVLVLADHAGSGGRNEGVVEDPRVLILETVERSSPGSAYHIVIVVDDDDDRRGYELRF
ncbi:MAG: hypothetical protein WC730_03070 [Patescibacteria group bacterium]|jgi:hypothetical protein